MPPAVAGTSVATSSRRRAGPTTSSRRDRSRAAGKIIGGCEPGTGNGTIRASAGRSFPADAQSAVRTETKEENQVKKKSYIRPRVVGSAVVHPC
ncbi:hypothetical protein RW64_05935 [Geobacter sulfurreducens]|nr:hypothetical protein RW64_05935 [Geobacter sulfurreducens]